MADIHSIAKTRGRRNINGAVRMRGIATIESDGSQIGAVARSIATRARAQVQRRRAAFFEWVVVLALRDSRSFSGRSEDGYFDSAGRGGLNLGFERSGRRCGFNTLDSGEGRGRRIWNGACNGEADGESEGAKDSGKAHGNDWSGCKRTLRER
jgi:hypothetical protein